MKTSRKDINGSIFLALMAGWFYILALDFFTISWGTGNRLGEFALSWGILFFLFLIFLFSLLIIIWLSIWRPETLVPFTKRMVTIRQKLGRFRWILALPLLILPVWFFQYSLWGLVFTNIYFRVFVWAVFVLLLAFTLTQKESHLIAWPTLLLSLLLSGAGFTLASVFTFVSDYPFSLHWSDGNRLWDYSLIFGHDLYNFPSDQPIPSLTSIGRQVLWGLPFLFSNSSIFVNRFWDALLYSLPSAILGWVIFKSKGKEWIFLGIWAFLFLNQGPIYTPLVLSAILIALTWKRPLWIGLPLAALAGYYAQISRWTWEFAPAIWAAVLEISGSKLKDARSAISLRWRRAIALAVTSVSAWILVPIILKKTSEAIGGLATEIQTISGQSLLWYRLLPNDTYPEGVLGGLLMAALPVSAVLFYLIQKKYWQPSFWQKLVMAGPLFAFLVVGLIISTKIGGGNNLHNLDMFLITLLFVTAIAWKNGGSEWFAKSESAPIWVKTALILLLFFPAYPSLRSLRPSLSLTPSQISQVKSLTGYDELTSPPINTMPSAERVEGVLNYSKTIVEQAEKRGEVLFIDQRQLLTFDYVPKIRLVPEYEKKVLMNQAMANSESYFAPYYQDLANQRFSLIITEPLKRSIKAEEGVFAEENDAWTNWVATPTLCFYEPIETFEDVYIQFLVPRREPLDCSAYLNQ